MLLSVACFLTLPYELQDLLVRHQGTYLAHRWHKNYSVTLYAVGSLYCELWLEQECTQPARYHALTEPAGVEAYIASLHLPAY